MFRSRFFWKLYASYALLIAMTAIVIGALVLGRLNDSLLDRLEVSLRAQALANWQLALDGLDPARLPAARAAAADYAERTGVRLTVIARDGAVLVDTHDDPSIMVNHLDRPEVQDALAHGFGRSTRYSRTLERDMFYVAHARDQVLIVRTSMPTSHVDELLSSTFRRMFAGAVVASLVALLFGALIARRITAPISEMTAAAGDILEGRFEVSLSPSSDELGILADAFNRLGVEVTRRISAITSDEAQLRAMLAGMVEGVVAVDSGDHIVFANNAFRRLLGIQDDSIRGKRLLEVVRVAGLDSLLEDAREDDDSARVELKFDNDGRETTVSATAHRFLTDGESGVVMVLQDVTELRRLESIRRDFVSNVSHELKTPLTSIRGYVETLLDGALEDEANNRRFLEKIDSNVGRLSHLVTDLLSLARIEEHSEDLQLESIDWVSVLSATAKRIEDEARTKGIVCRLDVPGMPVRVAGDREALTQIADNLVDNAIKYTPEGGDVSITLSTDETHASLRVRDTGIGIPAEDLDRIFERFYRVDKARSRELGGTGLGLSIVKHLVRAMDGDVSVESEVGAGSSFLVRLRLAG